MNYSKTERISELVRLLNTYRNEYYNKNAPSVSDEVYDRSLTSWRRLNPKQALS